MKITPLEIRQKTFEKSFRGLDKDEVIAFTQSLSYEWERMLDENKDYKMRLEKAEKEVSKLREVESTLFKTLKTAEDTSANVIGQANKTAELHMKETQINSEAINNEAIHKAKAIIENADAKAREIIDEMQNEVKELEENYRIIESQRDSVISQLKLLSGDVMEKVTKLKDNEGNMGIEGHLKKVKQMMRESSENTVNEPKINLPKPKTVLKEIKPTYEKPVIEKSIIEKPIIEQPIVEISTEEEKADEIKVKKNHILGNEAIERKPLKRTVINETNKVIEAVNQDDLSFFDQLED